MRLSAAVLADLSAIAAGQSAEPGDNRNALNLAMLESDLVLRGGTATFSDVFAAQVSTLGVSAQQAERMFETQNLVVQQVASLVDSVSGVSIDEESTNLIQFERAFQASSRLAVVVDEMLQTIVNLV
jgi:flagellar hook-associated protein 1 FlgK